MEKIYKLIKVEESFLGKDGKLVNSTGFYIVDDYGYRIKITNVFKRDYYTLLDRAEKYENSK